MKEVLDMVHFHTHAHMQPSVHHCNSADFFFPDRDVKVKVIVMVPFS